jgi:hypothetical protein
MMQHTRAFQLLCLLLCGIHGKFRLPPIAAEAAAVEVGMMLMEQQVYFKCEPGAWRHRGRTSAWCTEHANVCSCNVRMLLLLLLQVADAYLQCLKKHARDAVACQELAKKYLECRMDRWAVLTWPQQTRMTTTYTHVHNNHSAVHACLQQVRSSLLCNLPDGVQHVACSVHWTMCLQQTDSSLRRNVPASVQRAVFSWMVPGGVWRANSAAWTCVATATPLVWLLSIVAAS